MKRPGNGKLAKGNGSLFTGSFMEFQARPEGWQPDALPDLSDEPMLRADFETTGLRWWDKHKPVGLAVWAPKRKRGYYFPTAHEGGGNLPEEQVKAWMASAQGLRGKRVVNLNTKFDVHMSIAWGSDWRRYVREFGDVAYYAALIDDHRREMSLNAVARDVLGPHRQKVVLKGDAPIHVRPAWEVAPYAVEDVRLVEDIATMQGHMLSEMGLTKVRKLEDAVLPVTVEMEQNASLLDWEKLERWTKETEQALLKTLWELHRLTGLRVEPSKRESCFNLFRKLGVEVPLDPEDGHPSFAVTLLKPIAKTVPAVALLVRALQILSLRSKYLLKYTNGKSQGGLLRYALHQCRADEGGTVSGRYSSSGISKDPPEGCNIQQVTSVGAQKKSLGDEWVVRELFIPALGRTYWAADAKQIQLRLFADMAQNPQVIAAYQADPDGTDYHDVTLGMGREYMTSIRELEAAGNHEHARKAIKNTNFALMFGAGVDKTSRMNNMGQSEGAAFNQAYHATFPEVKRTINRLMNQAKTWGQVRTRLGRRTTFPGGERTHKALNAVIQGDEADVVKQTMVDLYAERERLGLTLRIPNHDELAGDLEDPAMRDEVQQILDRPRIDTTVPIRWDGGVGANWREAKP